MYIGLLYTNVRFVEKTFYVSFTNRRKYKISKILPDLKHLYSGRALMLWVF